MTGLEGTVPKLCQITAMNYTRNHHTNLIQKNCAENCVLLSFQSFPCAIKRCVNDVLIFQGCFDKIQGLLGKIQGLFKDLNKFFNFSGLFKGLMPFQGPCEPCIIVVSFYLFIQAFMLVQTQKMSAAFSIKWTDNTTMEFYNLKNQKAVLL